MPDYEGRYWISNEYRTKNWCGMHVAKDAAFKTAVHFVMPKVEESALIKNLNYV